MRTTCRTAVWKSSPVAAKRRSTGWRGGWNRGRHWRRWQPSRHRRSGTSISGSSRSARVRSAGPFPQFFSDAKPLLAQAVHHEVRVVSLAEAAVVSAEGALHVAFLHIEVVLEDSATEAQVRVDNEKVVVGPADFVQPERHDLHEAARAHVR